MPAAAPRLDPAVIDTPFVAERLMSVSQPHLRERYNRALVGFGLRAVALEAFRIDKAGWSPEVAEALGDPQYLDPGEVNRRFILLGPGQMELPVVKTAFSNTATLLDEFFRANQRQLTALTIRDVVYGEIEDSVFEVADIDDLLRIEQVQFRLSTADDLLGKAADLRRLADRLLKEPDAWRDAAMLARMAELAKVTGDIRTNELVPREMVFRHPTFWTSHFGGVYVFLADPEARGRRGTQATVIADPSARGFRRSRPWQVDYLAIEDVDAIHDFLIRTGRIDPPDARWINASTLLEQRALMLVAWLASQADPQADLSRVDARWAAGWVARNARLVEQDGRLRIFNEVRRRAADGDRLDLRGLPASLHLLVSRAKPDHPDRDVVNRLLSEFMPFDYFTRYHHHPAAFFRDLPTWPAPYRDFVAQQLGTPHVAQAAARP